VKRDALSDAEKKQLDDSLAQANSAAKERAAARAEFEKGQAALDAKNYNEALQHFRAAKDNKFADAPTMDKADTQIQATQKLASAEGGATGAMDAKALYRKGRDEYRSGDWTAARKDLVAARDAGYKAGFLEQSPDEILAKMDAKEKQGGTASAEAPAGAAPAPAATAEQPAPAAAPAADEGQPKLTAKQAYHKGRDEYRSGDWIAARRDLEQARSMGYKPGLFEDSPSKYLARMDKKEQADAQKAQMAQAQQPPPSAATDVTPPAPAPAPTATDTTTTTTTTTTNNNNNTPAPAPTATAETPARRPPLSPGPGYHALRPFTPSNTFAPRWQWAGFSWTSTSVSIYTVTDLRIPDWAILTPAALVLAWIVRRRLRAVPPGHCPHCRYDLTGNVSGVCPECGTPHSTGRDVLRAE
jgi:outer membrane protein assembly factor BamD (BamD/ComL family)